MTMKSPCLLFLFAELLLLNASVQAAVTPLTLEACLQQRVIEPASLERTVAELRQSCELELSALGTPVSDQDDFLTLTLTLTGTSVPLSPSALAQPRTDSHFEPRPFFTPYKKNYVIAGSMENDDGTAAFSGNSTDIKFELGLKFRLLPNVAADSPLAPLHFGYSQRSWWDILEASAPFREHNYNPEVFWEFDRSTAASTVSLNSAHWLDLFSPDRIGFEHQSNGLGGEGSRSWDRIYLERDYGISEMLSVNVKLWNIINKGDFNRDISDFMGYGALTTRLELNN